MRDAFQSWQDNLLSCVTLLHRIFTVLDLESCNESSYFSKELSKRKFKFMFMHIYIRDAFDENRIWHSIRLKILCNASVFHAHNFISKCQLKEIITVSFFKKMRRLVCMTLGIVNIAYCLHPHLTFMPFLSSFPPSSLLLTPLLLLLRYFGCKMQIVLKGLQS